VDAATAQGDYCLNFRAMCAASHSHSCHDLVFRSYWVLMGAFKSSCATGNGRAIGARKQPKLEGRSEST